MKAYNRKKRPKHHIKPHWVIGKIPGYDVFGDNLEWFKSCQLMGMNIKRPKDKFVFIGNTMISKSFYIIINKININI